MLLVGSVEAANLNDNKAKQADSTTVLAHTDDKTKTVKEKQVEKKKKKIGDPLLLQADEPKNMVINHDELNLAQLNANAGSYSETKIHPFGLEYDMDGGTVALIVILTIIICAAVCICCCCCLGCCVAAAAKEEERRQKEADEKKKKDEEEKKKAEAAAANPPA